MSDSVVLEVKKSQFMGLMNGVIRVEIAKSKKMGKSLLRYTDNDKSIEECFNNGAMVENEVEESIIETESVSEGLQVSNDIESVDETESVSDTSGGIGVAGDIETANMSVVVKSVLDSLDLSVENVPPNMSLNEAVSYLGTELVKNGYSVDMLPKLLGDIETNIEPKNANGILNKNECINEENSEIISEEDNGIEFEGDESEWFDDEEEVSSVAKSESSSNEVAYVDDDIDEEDIDTESDNEIPYVDDDIDDEDIGILTDNVTESVKGVSESSKNGVNNIEVSYIDDDIDEVTEEDIEFEDTNEHIEDDEDDEVVITPDATKIETVSSPSIESSTKGGIKQSEPTIVYVVDTIEDDEEDVDYVDDDIDEEDKVDVDIVAIDEDNYVDDDIDEEDVIPIGHQTVTEVSSRVEKTATNVITSISQPNVSEKSVTNVTVTNSTVIENANGGTQWGDSRSSVNNTVVDAPILNNIENSQVRNTDNGIIYDKSMSLIEFLRKNRGIRQKSEVLQYFSEDEVKKAIKLGRIMLRKDRIIL